MNNTKAVLPLAVAFGLGGLVGYIVANKLLAEKYNEEIQAEVDSVKAYYHDRYVYITDNNNAGETRPVIKSHLKPDLHTLATKETGATEEESTDARYFRTDEEEAQAQMDEDLNLEEQEELNEDLTNRYKDPQEPYLIDYAEWARPSDVFDKVDLYYYRADDILCDTKDSIIKDPEEILGWDWLNEMQKETTLFIRNEKLGIDYEVHSLGLAYSDEVSSRLETDRERKYRRTARAKKAMDDIATEHLEDLDEDGEYVIKRPTKAKKTATRHSNNYYDYSKVKSIEEAEEVDDNDPISE